MKHRFTVSEKDSEVQFHRVSQDLLTHNPKQGVNYWGGAEYPTMLIWAGRIYWIFPEGTAIGLAARQEGRRDKPACPFVAGFVAGWTNRSLGMKIEFQESKCVSMGDPECIFESVEFLRPKAEKASSR